MKRVECFEDVKHRCESALKKDLSIIPLKWIINQLNYLIDLEKGLSVDVSYIEKIKIGWIAVRELDGFEDQQLVNDLCLISSEVEKIKKEKFHENK